MTFETRKSNLISQYNLNKFIVGPFNMLENTAATQVIESTNSDNSLAYNPLVIYGEDSLGKTNLIHAIGNSILDTNPDTKIVYIDSFKFLAEVIRSLQKKSISEFKSFLKSADVLLVEDIEFFSGKERAQEEFFQIINILLNKQKQIILTRVFFLKALIELTNN